MTGTAEIAAALGGAKREGRGWRCLCPAHNDHHPSLSIVERGGKTLLTCRAGCDLRAVLAALRDRQLWPAVNERRGDGQDRDPSGNKRSSDADAVDRQARALDIWRGAVEYIGGTPAARYLRSRGLDPARLWSLWGPRQWPATVRYSERAALDPARDCRALIIAVHGRDGLARAVHRVMLTAHGEALRDRAGRRVKLSLGPIAGHAARGDCHWPDLIGRWGLAEGLESAFAASQLSGIPTWAAISAGNMPLIEPPIWARHVTIWADRDPPGMAAAGETYRRLRGRPGIETVHVLAAVNEGADPADLVVAVGHVG